MSKFLMTAKSKFTSHATGALLAVSLVFGAVPIGATLVATPAAAVTLNSHGMWAGFYTIRDSVKVWGARTDMTGGGSAAVLVTGDTLSIEMRDPSWHLDVGSTMTVSLTIDGANYVGTATVRGRHTIEIPDVSKDVLNMFIEGAVAVIDLDGSDINWTLDLHGFTNSMKDALIVQTTGIRD